VRKICVGLFLTMMSAGQCWSYNVMTSLHSCQKVCGIFSVAGPTCGSEGEAMSISHSCTSLAAPQRSTTALRNKSEAVRD
jgi:hypothetical protein